MISTPRTILERWLVAFNKADTEALTALYHEDAVNHQVATTPVEGRHAIQAMFAREFAAAQMVCIPENIFTDGSGPFWNGATPKVCAAVASSTSWTAVSSCSAATGTS